MQCEAFGLSKYFIAILARKAPVPATGPIAANMIKIAQLGSSFHHATLGEIVTERNYRDIEFANPILTCDVIMKGGITSGVVYPLALAELAKRYRFSNIGGTSAGAIAAAAAAAAEYGRSVPGKGFVRLATLPAETGAILFSLFQPTTTVKPLFNILVAALKAKSTGGRTISITAAAIWGFRWSALAGALAGVLIALLAFWRGDAGFTIFGLLLAVGGLVIGVLLALTRSLTKHLPDNHYGLCSGIQQPGYNSDGFTDWLADLIDDTAGRSTAQDAPLTFGDLEAPGARPPISLRMMTTNLMLRRPYSLPFQDQVYTFRKEDFEKIFPKRIMSYLARVCERFEPEAGEVGTFYKFPEAEKLPVVVAARMSLSFPLLISAVPLYARDRTMKGDEGRKLRLCLFSDGGLSSNFPIHFFDHMLPNAPTFAISLDQYDVRRDRADERHETRVWMPPTDEAGGGILLPNQSFEGIVAFCSRLIDAAKDWQDNLQSTLAGYRDRIVHVYLKPDEGGLNIVMPPELVASLGEYGAQAGQILRDDFGLDEHRWRRFLVAMDRLDQTFRNFVEAYQGVPGGPESFGAFLARYPQIAQSFKQTAQDRATLLARAASIVELAKAWPHQPEIPDRKLPHPKTDLRITPKP
jgi:hypothetical protein